MQRKPPTTQVHTPPASTAKERSPPAKRTPPTATKGHAMHERDPQSGGVGPTCRPKWREGTWWTTRTLDGGVEVLDRTHTETRRGMWWMTRVQRGVGNKNRETTPAPTTTTPSCQLLRQREKDTSRNTGRSGRQNAVTRYSTRREERVTVQGPVKKQQPNRMSHRGSVGQICDP